MVKRKSTYVCINITASLNRIELIQYDIAQENCTYMDSEECYFDPATRELQEDPERFQTALKRLYERNKIPFKTPTVLIIPSYFTRQYEIPQGIADEDLETILISEAERFYVFKKVDPEVGYGLLQNNQVLYTAYPQQALAVLKAAFIELKIPLFSIDCNYTAALRGLVAMGVVQDEVASQLKWGLMIISDFNVFMAVVSGSMIEKILEAPLSMQNEEEASLLEEIRGDFQEFYSYEVLNRMIIINSASKLYSSTLIEQLQFQGPTSVFDQNERTIRSLGAIDPPFPATLEAVGGSLLGLIPAIAPLELAEPELARVRVEEDRLNIISATLIGLGIVFFVFQFGLSSALEMFIKNETAKGAQLQTEINTTLNAIAVVPEVKRKLYVKQAMSQNYRFSNLLVKIGQALPLDAWLNEVTIQSLPDLKTLNVVIVGGALSSEPLNEYVKQLNLEVQTPPLSPNLTPKQDANQRYFEYRLTNPTSTAPGVPLQ